PRQTQPLRADRLTHRAIADVRQPPAPRDHFNEARPAGGEDGAEVAEDRPRLLDDVVAADEPTLLVDRDDARDEEQRALRSDGMGVMADRRRLAGDVDLVAPGRHGVTITRPGGPAS